jgi:hypothetical protein
MQNRDICQKINLSASTVATVDKVNPKPEILRKAKNDNAETEKKTPWSESAIEQCRPSERRLSAK